MIKAGAPEHLTSIQRCCILFKKLLQSSVKKLHDSHLGPFEHLT